MCVAAVLCRECNPNRVNNPATVHIWISDLIRTRAYICSHTKTFLIYFLTKYICCVYLTQSFLLFFFACCLPQMEHAEPPSMTTVSEASVFVPSCAPPPFRPTFVWSDCSHTEMERCEHRLSHHLDNVSWQTYTSYTHIESVFAPGFFRFANTHRSHTSILCARGRDENYIRCVSKAPLSWHLSVSSERRKDEVRTHINCPRVLDGVWRASSVCLSVCVVWSYF